MGILIRLGFLLTIVAGATNYLDASEVHVTEKIAGIRSAHVPAPPLRPPPEGSTSARRRTRPGYNSIQIAISIYPPGSNRKVSGVCSETDASELKKDDPAFCGMSVFDDSDFEIDYSNKVFGWVQEATRKFSPDSWYLLMQYDELPGVSQCVLSCGRIMEMPKPAETFQFLSGDNVFDVMDRMSTNIHEISHAFSRKNIFKYAWENDITLEMGNEGRLIYLTPSESYLITYPRDSLFPAARLARNIPESVRTLRYNTYISGSTSTQTHGVLALLDELNAYFLGSRFRYEMLEAYKMAGNTSADGFFEWISGAQGTMGAFFEIDYFILEYLLYMKSHHPRRYELLRSNQSFREAWLAVRTSYSSLLNGYFQTINDEMKDLNASGEFELKIDNNRILIRRTGYKPSSRLIISSAMERLLPVLQSSRYLEIKQDFALAYAGGSSFNFPVTD